MDQVKSAKELLVILHGKVYDLSEFAAHHPGGEEMIVEHKGIDATEDYESIGHPSSALKKVQKYLVGTVHK